MRKHRKYRVNIDPNRRGRTLSHTKTRVKSLSLSFTPKGHLRDPLLKLYALRESRVSLDSVHNACTQPSHVIMTETIQHVALDLTMIALLAL